METLRGGFDWFREHGRFPAHLATPDFVWDTSHFDGRPEQQLYEGAHGADDFLSAWGEAWEEWVLDIEEAHEVQDKVVAILRQRGRSKLGGTFTEMSLAMVWTFRDGKEARMDMYSDLRQHSARSD